MRITILAILLALSTGAIAQSFYLFVGTSTDSGSKGIYVYDFNTTTGKATWVSNTDGIVNPSFLTIAPDKKHIYAVTETGTSKTGNVSAFLFNEKTGGLTFLNKQESGGANPCYITVDKTNKWVIVGNYTDGNLAALRLTSDGMLLPASQIINHTGSSIVEGRQDKPHVHCTIFSPDENHLFVPDLGIDKVMTYDFKPENNHPLSPAKTPYTASEPGNGPRHLTFHSKGKFAYLIEELSGTVAAFDYKNGNLTFIQRIATHPENFTGKPGSADIHVSPDGKFLYASNRGEENNIAIFSIDKKTGKLSAAGYQPTEGKTPRNFIIDPTGKYVLAANQNSGTIVVFKRDKKTGLLTSTGEVINISRPMCLQMMEKM